MLSLQRLIITAQRPETIATRSLPRGETPVPSTWRAIWGLEICAECAQGL